MKYIPLTQGQVALVDDDDYEYLSQWKWCACKRKHTWYACHNQYNSAARKQVTFFMHRLLLGLNPGDSRQGDHIDFNGLNNQRFNLRVATKTESARHERHHKGTSSRFKGVFLDPRDYLTKRWRANFQSKTAGVDRALGYFAIEEDAARAYDKAAKAAYGKFAVLNFPEENENND